MPITTFTAVSFSSVIRFRSLLSVVDVTIIATMSSEDVFEISFFF